ncbi:MAG: NUDIX hydrolase [Patescibacteria group bacterium]
MSNASKIPDVANNVFGGEIFDVYQWEQELYDGTTATFEMLKRRDTAGIIAIVDDKIVILKDEQPHRGMTLTFPSGKVESGESWLEGAKRETLEETGMQFADWRLIYVKNDIPRMEYANVYFLAQNLISRGEQKLDAGEKIEVLLKDFDDAKELCNDENEYTRFAKPIFDQVESIEQLINLPELK